MTHKEMRDLVALAKREGSSEFIGQALDRLNSVRHFDCPACDTFARILAADLLWIAVCVEPNEPGLRPYTVYPLGVKKGDRLIMPEIRSEAGGLPIVMEVLPPVPGGRSDVSLVLSYENSPATYTPTGSTLNVPPNSRVSVLREKK